MKNNLTVVMPAYNEAESLASYLAEVLGFCHGHGYHLVVVDDGSVDGTAALLAGFASEKNLTVIRHKVNRGYGGALKSGIAAVATPYVVTIDADRQHSLDDVPRLFGEILTRGADMVVGYREGGTGLSPFRTLGKWIIRALAKLLLPLCVRDINSGIKIYDTTLAKRYLTLCPDTMAFSDIITLIFISQRHLVLELPVQTWQRRSGSSTVNLETAFDTVFEIINIVVLFNPLRIFFSLALLAFLAGILWGLPLILAGHGVSVGAMLSITAGLILFAIGLLAEQLSMIRKQGITDRRPDGA